MTIERAREEARRIFEAALRRVEPADLARGALRLEPDALVVAGQRHPLAPTARLVVLAIGKAAVPMARGALEALGARVTRGVVVTKRGADGRLPADRLTLLEASHPVPDASSVAAGEAVLDAARGLGEGDLVLVLLSGGGSALVEAPVEGITLDDIAATTSLLLRGGADIGALNGVRRALSRIKGGGLAAAASPARVVNLVISDVLGNPLDVIASGPTVPPRPGPSPEAIARRYGVWDALPVPVRARLARATAQAPAALPNVVQTVVLADVDAAARAALEAAAGLGYAPVYLGARFQGEARDFGRFWATIAREVRAGRSTIETPCCLVGGGETTVTVRGAGRGGRNTEMALAAALEIEGVAGIAIASLATDGDDGSSGAAGGVVVGDSARLARERGASPERLLADNDSATCLEVAEGLIVTGPTGTNVNDLYLALIP